MVRSIFFSFLLAGFSFMKKFVGFVGFWPGCVAGKGKGRRKGVKR